MKILFLVAHPIDDASVRYRVHQRRPPDQPNIRAGARQHGAEIAPDSACAHHGDILKRMVCHRYSVARNTLAC